MEKYKPKNILLKLFEFSRLSDMIILFHINFYLWSILGWHCAASWDGGDSVMSFLRHINETKNTEVNPEAKQKARDFIISAWTEEFPSNNAKVSPTFGFLEGDFLHVVCPKFCFLKLGFISL